MVFVLKDLGKLTTDFESIIELLLHNEKIESGNIEDSKENRAPLLEFLRSTLLYLNTSNDTFIPMEHRPAVFYGAVHLIIKHINHTRWISSTAKNTLLGLIEDKSGALPSISQLAQFHKSTNIFLTSIYTNNDSRNGLKEEHALSKLTAEHLTNFIRIGYELENSSQKNLMTFIAQNTPVKNSASSDGFRFLQALPTASALGLGSWGKFNTAVNSMIQKELGHKNAGTLKILSKNYPVRAGQLSILKDLREMLLSISEADKTDKRIGFTADRKAAILAGTTLLFYEQIKSEIGKWKSSEVYDELKEILDPDEISHQDKEALMTIASQFIRYMTIASPSKENRAFREEHLFSKTINFNLADTLKDFQDKIYVERIAALDSLMAPLIKVEKPSSSWSLPSLTSLKVLSIFGSKPKEDDDGKLATPSASATTPSGING